MTLLNTGESETETKESRADEWWKLRPRSVEGHIAVEECKPTWFGRVTTTTGGAHRHTGSPDYGGMIETRLIMRYCMRVPCSSSSPSRSTRSNCVYEWEEN